MKRRVRTLEDESEERETGVKRRAKEGKREEKVGKCVFEERGKKYELTT